MKLNLGGYCKKKNVQFVGVLIPVEQLAVT